MLVALNGTKMGCVNHKLLGFIETFESLSSSEAIYAPLNNVVLDDIAQEPSPTVATASDPRMRDNKTTRWATGFSIVNLQKNHSFHSGRN